MSRGLIVAIALVAAASVTVAAAQEKKQAPETTADKRISSKSQGQDREARIGPGEWQDPVRRAGPDESGQESDGRSR
jgi:hypothetical protein